MVLRIDEAELRAKLFEHKEFIGLGPVSNGIVNIVAGLFYIPTAITFQTLWLKIPFTLVGLFFLFYGIIQRFMPRKGGMAPNNYTRTSLPWTAQNEAAPSLP